MHGISERNNPYYSEVVQPEKKVVFNMDEKADGVKIRILYQGNGALSIDSISIRKIRGLGCWSIIVVLNLIVIIGIFKTDKITNPIIKRIVIGFTDIILIIVSSLFLVFCMEAILRSSFGKAILWIEKSNAYYLTTGFFIAFVIWGLRN